MLIIEYAIERSKLEILQDIASGVVPGTVSSFSELHDYVDANEYGGLCAEGTWFCLNYDQSNHVISTSDIYRCAHCQTIDIVD